MPNWTILLLALALATACSKPNPDFCCVTEAQCDELHGDEIRPCRPGQACQRGTCIASECSTSADCTDAASPVCILNLCVAKCTADEDCAGAAGGTYCASDGVCVGCTKNDQCPTNQALCDTEDRTCRGCEVDAECASGVCLEADGRCAAESEVIFTSPTGLDTGPCTRSAPCSTLQYALTKAVTFPPPSRLVIHVAGGSHPLSADITFDQPVYVDGTNTTFTGDGSGPYFTVPGQAGGTVTLANLVFAPMTGPAARVASGATLRVFNATITRSIETTGGTVIATKVKLVGPPDPFTPGSDSLTCTSGTLAVERSLITNAPLVTMNCQVSVTATTFDVNGSAMLSLSGGRIVLENNLIMQANEGADTSIIGNASPDSVVRFNTFVCTSAVSSDGVALYCDSTLNVTSNIFAYGSMHPHGTSTCQSKYSLYDAIAIAAQTTGQGNKVIDGASIFANKAARDFHLGVNSPARGGAEANLGVKVDLEGKPRPQPAGSSPDMGAFEAP